jgi:hypothetical protein
MKNSSGVRPTPPDARSLVVFGRSIDWDTQPSDPVKPYIRNGVQDPSVGTQL